MTVLSIIQYVIKYVPSAVVRLFMMLLVEQKSSRSINVIVRKFEIYNEFAAPLRFLKSKKVKVSKENEKSLRPLRA